MPVAAEKRATRTTMTMTRMRKKVGSLGDALTFDCEYIRGTAAPCDLSVSHLVSSSLYATHNIFPILSMFSVSRSANQPEGLWQV
mmetsp:Transcript_7002/g.10029  ORF Transcript_7002/g.10029 Transcript_7002/m.10029 type:complete len:85 (+) Transcript_7002:61-315(+)